MMMQIDKIRNAANAHHLYRTEGSSKAFELQFDEVFKMDWSFYKGEVPSEDSKSRFHL